MSVAAGSAGAPRPHIFAGPSLPGGNPFGGIAPPAPGDKLGDRIIKGMGANVDPPSDSAQALRKLEEFRKWFETRGVDGAHGTQGLPEVVWVGMENAAYVPANRFPGGNKEYFLVGKTAAGKSFSEPDVLAHEFAHRITEKHFDMQPTGNKPGFGASAAVREHISDVFANVLTGDRSGLIGETLKPGGLRSMADPSNPQYITHGITLPKDARDLVLTTADQGGGHLNTGTLSFVAHEYQAKFGLDALGDTYLYALQKGKITRKSNFTDVARAVWTSAQEMHGVDSTQAKFLRDTYKSVHLDPAPLGTRMAEMGQKLLRAVHIG